MFRGALAAGDVGRCMVLWAGAFPEMPQPRNKAEAEIMMHMARTNAASVSLEKRLYSHSWLTERGYRSQLPDDLLPEPRGPLIVPAVGISVNTSSKRPDRKEEAKFIESVMAEAAADAMLSGVTDPKRVSRIMWQARDKAVRIA